MKTSRSRIRLCAPARSRSPDPGLTPTAIPQQPGAGSPRIAHAVAKGVKSYSVDSRSELQKLIEMVPVDGTEISVRFKLPVAGAAYNFGAKFGATVDLAVELLKTVAAAGYIPSITFHPGTQCTDPHAWEAISVRREHRHGGGRQHRARKVAEAFHTGYRDPPQMEETLQLIASVAPRRGAIAGTELRTRPARRDPMLGSPLRRCRRRHVFLKTGIWLADRVADDRVIDRIEVSRRGRSATAKGPAHISGRPRSSTHAGDIRLGLAEGDFVYGRGWGSTPRSPTPVNGFGTGSRHGAA